MDMSVNSASSPLLYFNGINGTTGDYGLPPMTGEELCDFIKGEAAPENLDELRLRQQQLSSDHYGAKEGVDPGKLDESGWGVIFASDAAPEIKDALRPLLTLREQQAGERFHIYEGINGYRVGEDTKNSFLARNGAGPGPVDPDKVPYYLLIVGAPDVIPFRFQSQLDVQYAVGRIYFDSVEGYANYAQSVVAAETGSVKLSRRMAFFGVENPDDESTGTLEQLLMSPLMAKFANRPQWESTSYLKEQASKSHLQQLIGGADTPAFLFTASHGMEFPLAHAKQIPHQGALLCGDWPGPKAWRGRGEIPQDFYLAGDDLTSDAGLLGLVAFHFACYGGGTPQLNEFARRGLPTLPPIAPHPFVAGLPMRMLGHPRGGALAVVAHVERAWTYSFSWPDAGSQTTVFESTFERLLNGQPIGSALDYFNERYAELSTTLSDRLADIDFGMSVSSAELAGLWTANNDARGYTLLGDPAVRLAVAPVGEAPQARPAIVLTTQPPPPVGLKPAAFSVINERADEVWFTAFSPRAVAVSAWHKVMVYAHIAAALDAIQTDASQLLGKTLAEYSSSGSKASAAIEPGTEIIMTPQGEGLEFNPARVPLRWSGSWQRADFEMRAMPGYAGKSLTGSIACYVGPLLIADIKIPVIVVDPQTPVPPNQQPAVASAKMYQSVFASYSHCDTAVVKAVEAACKSLAMDYLRDVITLRSGENWSDRLLKMIEEADIFQLFWSKSSGTSPYVELEWQHALQVAPLKGPAFIRPIYWEKPLAKVPDALSSIHFAPVDFSMYRPDEPRANSDLKTLTVSTYTATGFELASDTQLQARTTIDLAGGAETYLKDPDSRYIEVHQNMVREAVAARLAYLELLARAKD